MGVLSTFDLTNYFTDYGIKNYFETGLGVGECLRYSMSFPFQKLFSVDLDEGLIEQSRYLEEYVPQLPADEPVLFWLDAHFLGSDIRGVPYAESIQTHKRDSLPLEDEVKIITRLRDTSKDVIICDDYHLICADLDCQWKREGNVFKERELAESLGIELNPYFLYRAFEKTHQITISPIHQGYFCATPLK
jgi:hypothetical protein